MTDFGSKIRVLVFVVAWTIAPGFPAIVCALTLPTQAEAAAKVPSCHESMPSAAAASSESAPAHRACCDDARTSCCLRALDIDGALAGVSSIDTHAAPMTATVVSALPLSFSSPVPIADGRSHAPPGSHFRVLRL